MRMCHWLCLVAVAAVLFGCGKGTEEAATAGGVEPNATATTTEAPSKLKPPVKDPEGRTKLRVTLDGELGAENAGIAMAVQRGFFRDAGLDVWAGAPLDPGRPVQYVAKGIDDLGLTQQPQIVVGREKGAPVVAIGSVIPRATESLIWLRGSGIRDVADLRGKKIAFPGIPFQKRMLEAVLRKAGLSLEDVQLRNVEYELVSALLGGQVDAIFGGSSNLEGADPELRRAKPVVTPVRALGIPEYEGLVVIARSDLAERYPRLIAKFMAAVRRGYAAMIANPADALAAMEEALGGPPDRELWEAQMKATFPLLSTSGRMSLERARALSDWMYEEGLAERRWPADELLSNAYR